ncbi:MAG: hypothetical protein ACTSUO_00120 [Candidatus Thorarchaeota archaeon]
MDKVRPGEIYFCTETLKFYIVALITVSRKKLICAYELCNGDAANGVTPALEDNEGYYADRRAVFKVPMTYVKLNATVEYNYKNLRPMGVSFHEEVRLSR